MNQIAVLLATYNGIKYLPEMVDSLETQTYSDFVCYIHDDGSTDGTLDWIKKWTEAHPERYQILEGPGQGSAKKNFLWMLTEVDASYYMFADQDDVWLPEKIEKSMDRMKEMERTTEADQPICVFTDMYVVDDKLQVLDASFIRYIGRSPERIKLSQLLVDNPSAGCTQLFNRPLRQLAGQLQDIGAIEMHDIWVLTLAAACGEGHVGVVDEPLSYYRQHGNNEMGAVAESRGQKLIRNLRELCNGQMRKKKKEFVQKARDLAGQLAMVEGIPEASRSFLSDLSEIGKQNKFRRIHFYRQHDISRLHRTGWMYLWI